LSALTLSSETYKFWLNGLSSGDCKQNEKERTVTHHVYKTIELTGSSPSGLEDAITTAIDRASKTLHNLRWFEVGQIRGEISGSKVSHWQVSLKVGFTLDDNPHD
jgi:flavin-binding protein dodecin